jgi:uncharacterized protein YecE (DUF72 family)
MPQIRIATTDVVYIRFHGLEGGFAHDYTRDELKPWAEFCRKQAEAGRVVYAYFNNDVNVRAPQNAKMLMQMVGEFCFEPEEREIPMQPRCVRGKTLERERRSARKKRNKLIGG